ncbi:Cytochrome C oxidase, cbb3-type, subunit III [Paracoccus solventivorans]|uniref:Cytochrome C oxidase, cbb3-type, subunit III n=1 Tax=Paracoccus solventivorans TaxID=53463 RepID=A0A1M7JI34_9RHOB|nr:cytochrome c [Paracoccus solventivorans]SHM52625.1 Cytochrome C oxidase, cbb3-type, subunit III [Paracoccus solventivorans]
MFDPRLIPALALVLAAGGTALADTPRLDAQRMFPSGEIAFQKICARCHTGREDAVGPDLTANDYDPDTIRHFARHGSGPMPAFTESMVDAVTLDQIAAHLASIRKETEE